jgi:hypothetical protein
MSCDRNVPCNPVEDEARRINAMLRSGRGDLASRALLDDAYNMNQRQFNAVVHRVQDMERYHNGDQLVQGRKGDLQIADSYGLHSLHIDSLGREIQERRAYQPDPRLDPRYGQVDPRLDPRYGQQDPRFDPRYDPRFDPRYGHRSQANEVVGNAVVGAIPGLVIDGGKGAAAGAAGSVVGEAAPIRTGDPVLDALARIGIGAGTGALLDGNKGAKAGGAGVLLNEALRGFEHR